MTQKNVAHKEGPDAQEDRENDHEEEDAYQGLADTEEVKVETEGEEEETNNWKTVNGTKYKCPICNQTCNTINKIKNHMQRHEYDNEEDDSKFT